MQKLFVIAAFLTVLVLGSSAQKLPHSEALARLRAADVDISSSGRCSDRGRSSCTSLEDINTVTINGVVTLKSASGCPLTVTGGTEVGHSSRSDYSHKNGYKVDYRLNSCLNNYIKSRFSFIGNRGEGAAQYKSPAGNIYALEGNHWDVTYSNNS